ncbi:hypothetical protein BGX26_005833, partial [Mortierella sp. AD094]
MYRPSWVQDQHSQHVTLRAKTQGPRPAQGGGEDDQGRNHSTPAAGGIYREGDINDGGRLSGATEDEESGSGSECSSGEEMQVDGPGYVGHSGAGESQLVAISSIGLERSGILTSENGGRRIHRRLGGCVGDGDRGQGNVQDVECIGTTTPHQLEGAASRLAFSPPSRNDRENHSCCLRQHDHHRPNQQIRRDSISTIARPNDQDMGPLHGDGNTAQDDIRSLTVQSSRCTLQEDGGAVGVVDRRIILPTPRVDMGSPPYRPIRNSSERQGSSIHLMEEGGNSLEPGRVQQLLVQHEQSLRVSAVVSNQQGPSEDQAGQGQGDGHHSVLDERALVPYNHSHVGRQASTDSEEPSLTSSGEQSTHPREEPDVVAISMEHRRQQAVDKGAGAGVLSKLFDSRAAQTRRKRRIPGQQAFIRWMQEHGHNPFNPSAMDLMNFLDYGLEEKKWKLTTVHTYKSAILQLFPIKQQLKIKEDELFKDFSKVMGTSTFKRLSNTTVDLAPILTGLQALGNNHSMDTKDLTAKTCFLLATCGLLRPDDLACTDASQCKIIRDELELAVVFPKEHRGGQLIIKTVVIKSHPVEFFCPVKAFVEYRRRTLDQDRFARTTHPKVETEPFTPLIRHVKRANLG